MANKNIQPACKHSSRNYSGSGRVHSPTVPTVSHSTYAQALLPSNTRIICYHIYVSERAANRSGLSQAKAIV